MKPIQGVYVYVLSPRKEPKCGKRELLHNGLQLGEQFTVNNSSILNFLSFEKKYFSNSQRISEPAFNVVSKVKNQDR